MNEMWGLINRNKLIRFKTKQKIIAVEGTAFYIYTDLEKAINARDRLSGPVPLVVVPLEEVCFISYEESLKYKKSKNFYF